MLVLATVSNWRAPGFRLVLAANTAHVLRLNKADVLALNKAHVLRLNTKICPVFTANTKEAAFGRLHKGGRPSAAPLCGFLYMGLSMGMGSCIRAAWAGLPHFYCANVSFLLWESPWAWANPIELLLGTIIR